MPDTSSNLASLVAELRVLAKAAPDLVNDVRELQAAIAGHDIKAVVAEVTDCLGKLQALAAIVRELKELLT